MADRRWLPVLLALPLGLAVPACGPISVNTVAVSPDGKLAFAVDAKLEYSFLPDAPRCDIILTDATGASLKRITANGRHNSWATFSPDGKTLLCVECVVEEKEVPVKGADGRVEGTRRSTSITGRKLVMYDIATGESRVLCSDEDMDLLVWPAFSPDGKTVAYATVTHLKIVAARDGTKVASWRLGPEDEEELGAVGFRWAGNDELFLASNLGSLGEIGFHETSMAVVLIRMGVVTELGAKPDRPHPTWGGERFVAATVLPPSVSVRPGVAVITLLDARLPLEEDQLDGMPLQLWVVSGEGIRRLTRDTRHYYYPEISPDGKRAAAVAKPVPTGPRDGTEKYDDFIPAPGDLVLVDMKTGKVDAVRGGEFATHPFWIDDDRLGFVQLDDENDEERIVILNLRDNRRLDLTRALAPRLKVLFARERARPRADQGDRP